MPAVGRLWPSDDDEDEKLALIIAHLNTDQNIDVLKPPRRCNCNPDNIATPIAASLGDVVTLGLLAWISDVLYNDYTVGGKSSPFSLFLP